MKKLVIANCFDCPYHEGSEKKSKCGIDYDPNRVYDCSKIPKWCSLENDL